MTTQILNTYKRRINSLKIITNEALVENIPASGLSWDNGTPEQISFMRQVYDACVSYSSSRGTFVADIPDSQLTTIEGKPLKSNAAEALSNLLREARSTASSNGIDITLGLTSGYRTASHQFRLWNRYFIQKYYPRTAPERANLDGGEHGSSAVIFMARHVRRYIASPGYSKHNSGVAVDFRNIENGRTFRNDSDSQHTSAWRTSWFYNWLLSNGSRFNYQPYAREPWHWSYTGANNAEEDIDESYNLNSREILFITTHPIAAYNINSNADRAKSATRRVYTRNGKGDQSDAFRHILWQALNTQSVGETLTRHFSEAHEYSTPANETNTDLVMDVHNNDLGIEIGRNNPRASQAQIEQIILSEIQVGNAIILNNGVLVKSNGNTLALSQIRQTNVINRIAAAITGNTRTGNYSTYNSRAYVYDSASDINSENWDHNAKLNWINLQRRTRPLIQSEPDYNLCRFDLPIWFNSASFQQEFLRNYGGEATSIIGDINRPITAQYFVIHDTAGTRDYNAATAPGGIHLWLGINSVFRDRDWHQTGDGTKLERRNNSCFVHTELTRHPISYKGRNGDGKSIWSSADSVPGKVAGTFYTDRQYELLARAYIICSIRKGSLLEVTIHREVDRNMTNGHSDPKEFDIIRFYGIITNLLGFPLRIPYEMPYYTFGIQEDRLLANNQGNIAGQQNEFLNYANGTVERALQYGPIRNRINAAGNRVRSTYTNADINFTRRC